MKILVIAAILSVFHIHDSIGYIRSSRLLWDNFGKNLFNPLNIVGPTLSKYKNLVKSSIKWVANVDVIKTVSAGVGKYIIRPPLLGIESIVNTKEAIKNMGSKLVKKLVRGIGNGLKNGWEQVEAIQLPGWQLMLVFPNAMISIVDKTTNTAWFLMNETGKTLAAAEAFVIYSSLQVISKTLGPAMRLLNLNCVNMKEQKYKVDSYFVDTLELGPSQICGISNLQAVNNVTLSSTDQTYKIVTIPYEIEHIEVNVSSANVTDYSGYLLEKTPMKIKIKKTKVVGTVYFSRGTFLKFLTIKLRVKHLVGFDIKIEVEKSKRTGIMDVIEGISDVLESNVKDAVNKEFKKVETKLSEMIIGTASPSRH